MAKNPALRIFENLNNKLKRNYKVVVEQFDSMVLRETIMRVSLRGTDGRLVLSESFPHYAWGSCEDVAMKIGGYCKKPQEAREMVREFFNFKTTVDAEKDGE